MPFLYAAMLSSQLVVTVADRVPEFDVGPSCREATVSNCLDLEKWAHEKLIESWPHYTAREKAMCVMEEKMAGPPSYTGWLTCLDINASGRRIASTDATGSDNAGAGAGSAAGLKRGVHRRRGSP
jgi:hypothetical protein